MAHAIGSFDKNGSPTLKIKVGGVFSTPAEFTAIIDTGFTGFLSMPLIAAFPLGLPLSGTTSVILADGQDQSKLMAQCRVTLENESDSKFGLVILEPSSTDILAGMEFLRTFKFGLFVSSTGTMLFDDDKFREAMKVAQAGSKKKKSSRKTKADAPSPPSPSSSEPQPPFDQSPSSDSS